MGDALLSSRIVMSCLIYFFNIYIWRVNVTVEEGLVNPIVLLLAVGFASLQCCKQRTGYR